MSKRKGFIIAVHAGAGYHSPSMEAEYKKTCALACLKAISVLKAGGTSVEASVSAVKVLEDAACTNAGFGSTLTIEGSVECDASVMDGHSLLYGAVGCLPGIKNPITVARKLLDDQSKGVLSLGRIPPCMLVGTGAAEWAQSKGIDVVSPDRLKSENAVKTYKNHKRRLQKTEERMQHKRQKYISQNNSKEEMGIAYSTPEGSLPEAEKTSLIHDTVGAVCLDHHGNLAAAVSSGGISLKQPGRIGPAAMFGAGCWAYNAKSCSKPGIAVATSGTGEHIMRSILARECGECVQGEDMASQALDEVFRDKFLESEFLHLFPEKFGGVLVLKHHTGEEDVPTSVELLLGHSTSSMCVGYMTNKHTKPKTIISRLPEDKVPGKTFTMEGHHFHL